MFMVVKSEGYTLTTLSKQRHVLLYCTGVGLIVKHVVVCTVVCC